MDECNCPHGSYGIKHTPRCYEATIERLQKRIDSMHNVLGLMAYNERLRALVAQQQRNCSCPYGDCTTCEEAKAALGATDSASGESNA